MVNTYDIPSNELIDKTAEHLKKIEYIKPPAWAPFVKTGMHKERPPVNPEWWFIRAAAVLRSIQQRGPIGVAKLRAKYGGRKNRGVRPERFYKGSGSILRKVIQQLEQAELIQKGGVKGHKGRIIASKGHALLTKTALEIMKKNRVVPSKKQELAKKTSAKPKAEKKEKNG